eukprot:205172-Pelagomonas_calceolata.AAC.1
MARSQLERASKCIAMLGRVKFIVVRDQRYTHITNLGAHITNPPCWCMKVNQANKEKLPVDRHASKAKISDAAHGHINPLA